MKNETWKIRQALFMERMARAWEGFAANRERLGEKYYTADEVRLAKENAAALRADANKHLTEIGGIEVLENYCEKIKRQREAFFQKRGRVSYRHIKLLGE